MFKLILDKISLLCFISQVDIGRGVKPVGYYVQRSCGLFPSPLPQDSPSIDRAEKLFHFMGTFFAKCIQDSRLVDIPLSRPFLKLMCMGDVVDNVSQSYRQLLYRRHAVDTFPDSPQPPADDDLTPTEESEKELIYDPPKKQRHMSSAVSASGVWYAGLLSHDDFMLVEPHRARFLQQLLELAARKHNIVNDKQLTDQQRNCKLQQLTLTEPPVKVEDLG